MDVVLKWLNKLSFITFRDHLVKDINTLFISIDFVAGSPIDIQVNKLKLNLLEKVMILI